MTDFAPLLQPDRGQPAHALHVVHPDAFDAWHARQGGAVRAALAANRVTGAAGNRAVLPGGGDGEDRAYPPVSGDAADSPGRVASLGTARPG